MNLIGHMVCAEYLGPDGRLGAMIPDLLSLFDRKLRPMKLLRSAVNGEREPGSLGAGVRFHFYVDSAFHRSDLFRESADLIREGLLAASQTPGLKRFAVAHVLTELFLDHLLILEKSTRLIDFYSALARGRSEASRVYLLRLPGIDWSGFSAFLGHLEEIRFADGYADRRHLLDRMDRILLRLRQRRLEAAERKAALAALDRHAGRATDQLVAFIAEMRHWDPAAYQPVPDQPDGLSSAVDSHGHAGLE
jgi:hypothetical protein